MPETTSPPPETTKPPRAPAGLQRRGRAFWRQVVADYELSTAELALLAETAGVLDEIDRLRAAITEEGVTVAGSKGQPRAHPLWTELQRSRATLGRLIAQLQLPGASDEPVPSIGTLKARHAAETRWRPHTVARSREVAGNG